MPLEERQGVLDRATEKGILLGGVPLSYSKWFQGDRLSEDALGRTVTVLVDRTDKGLFVKKVVSVGEKPPEPPKGGLGGAAFPRRLSPEELELKRAERVQIARSVSLDRAIELSAKGLSLERIAPTVKAIEEYRLSGRLSAGLPPSASKLSPAPPRPLSQAVGALFNEARRAGLVADWKAYADLVRSLPGLGDKDPYALTADEFARVELHVRKALAEHRVA
jgi:hypothetical protein